MLVIPINEYSGGVHKSCRPSAVFVKDIQNDVEKRLESQCVMKDWVKFDPSNSIVYCSDGEPF